MVHSVFKQGPDDKLNGVVIGTTLPVAFKSLRVWLLFAILQDVVLFFLLLLIYHLDRESRGERFQRLPTHPSYSKVLSSQVSKPRGKFDQRESHTMCPWTHWTQRELESELSLSLIFIRLLSFF